MVMHIGSITGNEVEHPRTKIISAEQVNFSSFFVLRFALLLSKIEQIHDVPPRLVRGF